MDCKPAFKLMDCKPALKLNGPIAGLIQWVLVASIAMLSCFVGKFVVGRTFVLGIKFDSGKRAARNKKKVSRNEARGRSLYGNCMKPLTNNTLLAFSSCDIATTAASEWCGNNSEQVQ